MSMEEQGQQSVWEFIKKLLKKGLHVLTNAAIEKADKSFERYQVRDVKQLVKKNPNMGVVVKDDLTKKRAYQIGRELDSMHQYFSINTYTDIDTGEKKWKITTTAPNKTLVDSLDKKFDDKEKAKKQGFDERLADAKARAAERNKELQKQMPVPEKHKENDMSL